MPRILAYSGKKCILFLPKPAARQNHYAILLVGDELVEHFPGDDGVDDTHQRHQEGGQHIQGEYELVGAVVGDEAFEHGDYSFDCAQLFG